VPHRIHTGEIISAVSALVLAPLIFAVEWYGAVGLPRATRSGLTTAENAWTVLTNLRWLMLLTVFVAVGTVVLHATQSTHGSKTDTGWLVTLLGGLTMVLLGYRVLINPPNPHGIVDVKVGGYLGLLAALGIAVGGLETWREERLGQTRANPRRRSRNRVAAGGSGG
jgi:uncharacterized membrane protein